MIERMEFEDELKERYKNYKMKELRQIAEELKIKTGIDRVMIKG